MSKALDSAAPLPWAHMAGYDGGLRYVSAEPSKNLTAAELAEGLAAKKAVGLVYEDRELDFLGGANAGIAKAAIAAPILAGLPWPAGRPVYCAFDVTPAGLTIQPDQYQLGWEGVQAFAHSLRRPPAAYGPRPFLYWLAVNHGVRFLWEIGSSFFNTGPEPPGKTLQQHATQVLVAGVWCDENDILTTDWGQVPAPPTPIPPGGLDMIIDASSPPYARKSLFGAMSAHGYKLSAHAMVDGTWDASVGDALEALMRDNPWALGPADKPERTHAGPVVFRILFPAVQP